jgi:hypothetical protein
MKLDEYLEKVVAEGYKREIDQEENVARSLPFVAASLAVLVSILGFVRNDIPALSVEWFAIGIWALVAVLGILILIVIYYLFHCVRRRQFRYITKETELLEYSEKLREFYSSITAPPSMEALSEDAGAAGPTQQASPGAETESAALAPPTSPLLSEAEVESAVSADLRQMLIRQYAEGATHNRAVNVARSQDRANALQALVMALLIAFVVIISSLIEHGLQE